MIEKIPLSKLTKKYINNHDVWCNGVHCRYVEREFGFGRIEKTYDVYGKGINDPIRKFKTLADLKNHISIFGN
jgi:hypothetical protein